MHIEFIIQQSGGIVEITSLNWKFLPREGEIVRLADPEYVAEAGGSAFRVGTVEHVIEDDHGGYHRVHLHRAPQLEEPCTSETKKS